MDMMYGYDFKDVWIWSNRVNFDNFYEIIDTKHIVTTSLKLVETNLSKDP